MSAPSLPVFQPAGIAVYPLIDGRVAWAVALRSGLTTGLCGPFTNDEGTQYILDLLHELLPPLSYLHVSGIMRAPILRHFTPPAEVIVSTHRHEATVLYRQAYDAIPIEHLHFARQHRRDVPPGLDPYMIATDASLIGNQAGWAYVTGAGWYATGLVQSRHNQVGEWVAACEAIRLYRPGTSLTLLIDNTSAGLIIQAIAERSKITRPDWLPVDTFNAGYSLLHTRTVRVLWIRRNSHPLHALADKLCGEVSRGKVPPTAISHRAQRTSQMHSRCPN